MNEVDNVVMIAGNLTKDANFHEGKGYFTLAVNRSYKEKSSSTGWKQVTTYAPCRINGKLADVLSGKLKQGNEARVRGMLSTYTGKVVTDKDGKSFNQPMFIIDVQDIGISNRSLEAQA